MSRLLLLAMIGACSVVGSTSVHAQQVFRSGIYSASGHTTSDGTNVLRGTLGQTVVTNSFSENGHIRPGFWNQVGPALAPRAIMAPALIQPAHESVDVERDVTLIWTEVEDAASYDLQLATDATFSSTVIDSAGLESAAFEVTDLTPLTTYFWRVRAVAGAVASPYSDPFSFTTARDVSAEQDELPDRFLLHPSYPNPFNPSTRIQFSLPQPAHVTLKVYNALGQEVRTLVDEPYDAGRHTVVFSAGDLPSGVYLYAIRAGEYASVQKMVLLK